MNKIELKVYIVDDEEAITMGINNILTSFKTTGLDDNNELHFTTKTFFNGEDFLESLKTEKPQIVLLDYMLPGISGLEILENHLNLHDDIIPVLITAYANLETAIKATKLGAYDILAKPFTPEELRYLLRKTANHYLLLQKHKMYEQEKKQIRFQFISILAHELKSPINAVDGFLDILKNKIENHNLDIVDHIIGRSITRIEEMRKLINDILDLTRIEAGKTRRELKEIDFCFLIKESLLNFSSDIKKRELFLKVNIPETCIFKADETEIKIIINNLISNAIKYNKFGGRLHVCLRTKGKYLRFYVRDSGIGISREDQLRLFSEFIRIKNEKTKNISGSGLGLSIIKKITSLYDGSIALLSKEDRGSLFLVRLKNS